MAKAHVDPAELRRFARELQKFNAELEAGMQKLHSRMISLESTWKDQEQQKFQAEFEQAMRVLARFVESSHQHSVFLGKKARLIEEYLQQH